MKRYNGKNYLEVVAVISIDNIVTNDHETISALMEGRRVRKFIDRDDANLMEYFGVWDNPRGLPVIFYYHEISGDTVNAFDVKREYVIDGTPVTPLDLIRKAREILNTSEIYDTRSAAIFLRHRGHSVMTNSIPSFKYEFRNL